MTDTDIPHHHRALGKPSKKNLFLFGFFQKGGGVMSEPKLFKELLCLDIFQEEGGLPISKVVEELFCLILDIYQEGGGGVTWFQNFWGTFLLAFGHFSGEGGGLPDSKVDEEHF